MTKKDIVRRIADDLCRTTIETAPIVQMTLDAIVNVLAEEGRVELRNFGVFLVKRRKARQGRNPRTGEKVDVGERMAVTFKPGGGLKTQMQSRFEKRASKTGIGKNIAGTYLRGKVLQTSPWEWSPSDGTSSYSGRA